MADVLIRNVSAETLNRIDCAAARAGLSRAAYLREQLDRIASPLVLVDTVTAAEPRLGTLLMSIGRETGGVDLPTDHRRSTRALIDFS